MLIASRAFALDGKAVTAGQVLDGIWPALRERTRRVLLSERWVIDADHDARVRAEQARAAAVAATIGHPTTEPAPVPRKRGRPRKVKED